MKQSVYAYLFSILFLLLGSLITSSLLSGLYYYHVLSTNVYEILAIGLGVVLFLIAGFLLGKKTAKKALIHAFIFIVPFLLIATLSQDMQLGHLLVACGKAVTFTLGTIIGVNLSSTH